MQDASQGCLQRGEFRLYLPQLQAQALLKLIHMLLLHQHEPMPFI